jgi:hypothetical protein
MDERGSIPGRSRDFFLFTVAFRQSFITTQLAIHWTPNALSPVIKRPKHEADHSPPSISEVNNAWNDTSIRLYGVELENFTFHSLTYLDLRDHLNADWWTVGLDCT